MKFITWLLIILAAMTVSRMNNARKAAARRTAAQPGKAPKSIESMVGCAHCGIYMPRSEALLIGKRTWCCEDHARRGPASGRQA
ncbi:PP0621 family protein [Bordetella sp. FB-8]|uniref:PP0621 family protein n=1 Tax=Bordetella sp. FB-8 TaxID=1159870 RepID=UPI00036E6E32|nr:PP0621 family protein [Bordetella sp. FB-8]